jgi:predicted HTH transcriptional regulator
MIFLCNKSQNVVNFARLDREDLFNASKKFQSTNFSRNHVCLFLAKILAREWLNNLIEKAIILYSADREEKLHRLSHLFFFLQD